MGGADVMAKVGGRLSRAMFVIKWIRWVHALLENTYVSIRLQNDYNMTMRGKTLTQVERGSRFEIYC